MAERNTVKTGINQMLNSISLPVAASTTIEAGKIVCVNAAGYAIEGAVATTLKCYGRANETVDNSAGANGALQVDVEMGVFTYANSGGDALTIADRLNVCYVEDDQTIAQTDGGSTLSKAGRVIDVTSAGVVVQLGHWA